MLLKREGAGEFRELTDQEVQDLCMKFFGKKKEQIKRPIEFIMLGKKGKVNGRTEMVYQSSKSLYHTFTCRENDTTVEYGYCHRLENVRNGNLIEQKLMSASGEPWAQKLGIQFRINKKKIICPPGQIDKALYLAMYHECSASPYRGTNPPTYELVKREEKARMDVATAKQKVALQNQILNELDLSTLRAYLASGGMKDINLMEEDEVRAAVYHDAMKDPEKFKMRINSSSMNLRADVSNFINEGLLAQQQFQKDIFWKIAFGDMKGELLCKVAVGASDEVLPLVQYFFDNPKVLEDVKYEYLRRIGGGKPTVEALTLGSNEALSRVEKYANDGLVMYVPMHKKVVLAEDGKKRAGSADLCKVDIGQDWKLALALAIEKDPSIETQIPL